MACREAVALLVVGDVEVNRPGSSLSAPPYTRQCQRGLPYTAQSAHLEVLDAERMG